MAALITIWASGIQYRLYRFKKIRYRLLPYQNSNFNNPVWINNDPRIYAENAQQVRRQTHLFGMNYFGNLYLNVQMWVGRYTYVYETWQMPLRISLIEKVQRPKISVSAERLFSNIGIHKSIHEFNGHQDYSLLITIQRWFEIER